MAESRKQEKKTHQPIKISKHWNQFISSQIKFQLKLLDVEQSERADVEAMVEDTLAGAECQPR